MSIEENGPQRQVEALWQVLDAWEPEPVSLDFNRRLHLKISEDSSRRRQWRLHLLSTAPLLGFLAMAMLIGHPMKNREAQPSACRVATPRTGKVPDPAASDLEMLRQIDYVKSF